MNQETIEKQKQVKEPSSTRLIFTLGMAGFLSGIILVAVYMITLPVIEANKAEALRKAIYKVLPGCSTYRPLQLKEGKLIEVVGDQPATKERKVSKARKLFAGFNESGELIGFAIPGSEPGFQDVIGAIFGYDAAERIIIGFEVLESKETPGLGDKIMKDKNFQENFISLKIDPELVPVKAGQKKKSNEVETITGATISSRAIVRLLQQGIDEWRPAIEDYILSNQLSIAVVKNEDH